MKDVKIEETRRLKLLRLTNKEDKRNNNKRLKRNNKRKKKRLIFKFQERNLQYSQKVLMLLRNYKKL